MVLYCPAMESAEEESLHSQSSEEEGDELSDGELQEAFTKGLLKPGMNVLAEKSKKFVNNVTALRQCLADFRRDLPWVERLDMTNPPAEDILAKAEGKVAAGPAESLMPKTTSKEKCSYFTENFSVSYRSYRQGQATVLEALPLLKVHNIATKRPDDYFAEMAKSDQQMQKIRQKLLTKQMILERSEKAKKLREQRKFGKQVQVAVIQKRQKEKKAMMSAVKKYQKGMTDKLDFLEGDQKNSSDGSKKAAPKKGPNSKRKFKDQKFGFGGKKSGKKWNTKESFNDVSSFRAKTAHDKGARKGKGGNKNKRPGKSVRRKMKGRS